LPHFNKMKTRKLFLSILFLAFSFPAVLSHDDLHPRTHGHGSKSKKVFKRSAGRTIVGQEDSTFWRNLGQEELENALKKEEITNVAKNVILFIGDGMSLPTVAAARILKGQKQSPTPEEGFNEALSWENFPNVGLSKTYCGSNLVPDSASTASAMYTGVKTSFYTMGYDGAVVDGDPSSLADAEVLEGMLDWAQAAGKKTGFVTTTRMSHATPAAMYAKTVYRFWEGDQEIQKAIDDEDNTLVTQAIVDQYGVKDITRQLIENTPGKDLDIMLGGGLSSFLPKRNETNRDPRWDYAENGTDYWDNYRLDGRNLVDEWLDNNPGGVYVGNATDLLNINLKETEKVMGIFKNSYVTFDEEIEDDCPHLVDMATQAVKFLQEKSGDDGYYIMIEGGKIDSAHHLGRAATALSETLALDLAVQKVLELVDLEDTLVIVTADHAHTLTIGGYPKRTQSILGVVGEEKGDKSSDGDLFTILAYANGPGYTNYKAEGAGNWTNINRQVNLTGEQEADLEYTQASAVPLDTETHGGDDVGIWATGPWAHLVHGVHQQSYIAQVMSYASCVGPHSTSERCTREEPSPSSSSSLEGNVIVVCSLLVLWIGRQ